LTLNRRKVKTNYKYSHHTAASGLLRELLENLLISKVTVKIANGDLIFDFELLRKNEIIQFEAICEVQADFQPSFMLSELMTFHHRIPNTRKVKKVTFLPSPELAKMAHRMKLGNYLALTIAVAIGLVATFSYFFENSKLRYLAFDEQGNSVEVSAYPLDNGKLLIVGLKGNLKREASINEFRNINLYKPVITRERFSYFLLYWFRRFEFLLMFIVTQGGFSAYILLKYRRTINMVRKNSEMVPGAYSSSQ
jgi:hypothetical protein